MCELNDSIMVGVAVSLLGALFAAEWRWLAVEFSGLIQALAEYVAPQEVRPNLTARPKSAVIVRLRQSSPILTLVTLLVV